MARGKTVRVSGTDCANELCGADEIVGKIGVVAETSMRPAIVGRTSAALLRLVRGVTFDLGRWLGTRNS